MTDFLKNHKYSLLLVLTGIAFYWSFGYDLDRSDFIKLLSLYTGLFFISFKLIQLEKNNFWFLAGIAVLFRLIFIVATPNLSQDFYRFIWDGTLILEGLNPYLSVPNEVPTAVKKTLIQGMGSLSAGNYTSYPPVNQLLFTISAFLGEKSILSSVIAMRCFIILADLGILYFGRKLLLKLNLPVHQIFWFILNPFIIIELTGNLHFEGVMLFFLLWSVFLLHQKKWIGSAVLLGISVSVKLLPLLFLPLLWNYFSAKRKLKNQDKNKFQSDRKLGLNKLLIYYLIVGLTILVSFLPFISSEFISNFSSSIALWFQKFEFNASVYYIIRWIGFQLKGYNIIATAGKILPLIVILILAGLAIFRRNNSTEKLLTTMLVGASVYFFLSTTVHPWYIAMPLLLSVFTKFRFALVWSFLVMLSYSAYTNAEFQENYWLIAVEYCVVIGVFLFEFFRPKQISLF
ncbi:glycosyltransferase 87 family protein [Salegentibacter sp. JZCK2]|uniref:glycosyltransferase 87 family protein n=1 Tax=Salegentibacter tibetensis TaxID=2873600 RepID=UPI001CCE43E1|nr:glycosyltransferase 87 family protein [Salegentibacter tibetensis]MBZ9731495.1 glycosyltransferase 87 family protein [Salegentibacter tibetensis]